MQKNGKSNRDSEIVFREVKNLGSSCTCKLKVQQLQQLLEEEMQRHVVLENAMDHVSVELTGLSCILNDEGELLSNIASMESNVTMPEEEIVSLHFQLIQERNERRLAEYYLKQLPSQSQIYSPGNLKRSSTLQEDDQKPCKT